MGNLVQLNTNANCTQQLCFFSSWWMFCVVFSVFFLGGGMFHQIVERNLINLDVWTVRLLFCVCQHEITVTKNMFFFLLFVWPFTTVSLKLIFVDMNFITLTPNKLNFSFCGAGNASSNRRTRTIRYCAIVAEWPEKCLRPFATLLSATGQQNGLEPGQNPLWLPAKTQISNKHGAS